MSQRTFDLVKERLYVSHGHGPRALLQSGDGLVESGQGQGIGFGGDFEAFRNGDIALCGYTHSGGSLWSRDLDGGSGVS